MAKEQEKPGTDLMDFNWEETGADIFFEDISPKTATPAPTSKEETKAGEGKEEEKKVEENDDYFEDSFKEEPKESKREFKEGKESVDFEKSSEDNLYKDVFKDLKENGIFKHVTLEEGENLDAEKLFALQEEEYETEVSERLKAWATQELDDDAKAFIKFKREGGNTADFFETYKSGSGIPQGDIEDEEYQDEVIRFQLREDGYDDDDIEDRLDSLTESGKKQKFAERYDAKLKAKEKERKDNLLKEVETQKAAAKEQELLFKSTVKETLDSVEDINGFKISPLDKTKILNFLTKKEHKVNGDRVVTGFQKKLSEVFQDTNKVILLAKLIESDFDMSDFEKQVATKKTRQIKSNLDQRKSYKTSYNGSSLADLF